MMNFIEEKDYYNVINLYNIIDLFELFNNPHNCFIKKNHTDPRGYSVNYEMQFNKIFLAEKKDEVASYHQKHFNDDYDKIDFWKNFVFRGQSNTDWELETTFFREYTRFGGEINTEKIYEAEKSLLREFKRNFKRFSNTEIVDDDYYEWFSIMQHFGAPTRFLDFTYSFFVALYFASNNIQFKDGKTSFSVFALNRLWLEENYFKKIPDLQLVEMIKENRFAKNIEIQKRIVNNFQKEKKDENNKITQERIDPFSCVFNMNPFNLNSRIANQRGLFIVPTNLSLPFVENLKNTLINENGTYENTKVLKINMFLNKQEVVLLYKNLRNMNIGGQTLFENRLDSMGEVLKRKLMESRYTDVLSVEN